MEPIRIEAKLSQPVSKQSAAQAAGFLIRRAAVKHIHSELSKQKAALLGSELVVVVALGSGEALYDVVRWNGATASDVYCVTYDSLGPLNIGDTAIMRYYDTGEPYLKGPGATSMVLPDETLMPSPWPQASGSIHKAWLGYSTVEDFVWPTDLTTALTFTKTYTINGREQHLFPVCLIGEQLSTTPDPTFLHVITSHYRSVNTIFTTLGIYNLETGVAFDVFDIHSTPVPQNTAAWPTWMRKPGSSSLYLQDPVDDLLWGTVIAPCLMDFNGVPKNTAGTNVGNMACAAFKCDPATGITSWTQNTLATPACDPTIGGATSNYTANMGAAHVAISGTRMIQAHPAANNIALSERAGVNGLTWTVRATPDWYTLIPAMLLTTPVHILPGTYCRTNPASNNSPARIVESTSTNIRDKFVFPVFTIYEDKWNASYNNMSPEQIGDSSTIISALEILDYLKAKYNTGTPVPAPMRSGTTFRSYLWAIYANSTNSVVTKEARILVERTNPTISEVRYLTGQIANALTYVLNQINTTVPGFFGSYSYSDLAHGHFTIITETPVNSYFPNEVITAITRTWGGFLDYSVTDLAGVQYPFAPYLKRHLRCIPYPMPLGLSNDAVSRDVGSQPALFDFCLWKSWSNSRPNSYYTPIDPQMVTEDDGKLYLCFLDSEWVMAGNRIGAVSEAPFEANGYIESSRIPYIVTNSYSWPGFGNHPDPYPQTLSSTTYCPGRVYEIRKTKLIICPKVGDPLIVDITKSFTGSFRIDLIDCPDAMPIPENVWQIGIAGSFVLLLKDDRDVAQTTPYPVLEVRNKVNGALVSTYNALVPAAVRADRYTTDTATTWTGECKWYLHGRRTSPVSSPYQASPGPRFKTVWNGSPSAPIYFHVSVEGYEKRVGVTGSYTFQSRVDYTVLRISPEGMVTLVSQQSALRTCSAASTTGNQHQQVLFSDDLPRPEALIAMSVASDRVFVPSPTVVSTNTDWAIRVREAE